MVVDDDPDFLSLVSGELEQIPGVNVTAATSPDEALDLLTNNNFDLVVSDWALDSLTAPDVFTQADGLMERPSTKTPVLFMSGSEKVGQTQRLKNLNNFEPVSFLLKRCGPPVIAMLARLILDRFWTRKQVLQPCLS